MKLSMEQKYTASCALTVAAILFAAWLGHELFHTIAGLEHTLNAVFQSLR